MDTSEPFTGLGKLKNQIKYMYNLNESVNRVCLQVIGVSKMRDGKSSSAGAIPQCFQTIQGRAAASKELFFLSHQCFSPSFIPMPARPTTLFVMRIVRSSLHEHGNNQLYHPFPFVTLSFLSFFQSITHISPITRPYNHLSLSPPPIRSKACKFNTNTSARPHLYRTLGPRGSVQQERDLPLA